MIYFILVSYPSQMEYITEKQPNCGCVTHNYNFWKALPTWLERCPEHGGSESDAIHTLTNRRETLRCMKEDIEAELERVNQAYRAEQDKLRPIFKASFEIRQEEALHKAKDLAKA